MRKSWVVLLSVAVFLGAGGGEVKIPVAHDNSIVLVDKEWGLNAGGAESIRIKGNQHLVVMSFDLSPIKGKVVKSAELICVQDKTDIDWLTISTVQAPWDEMKSSALTSGTGPVEGWGVPGELFPAVTGSNGFSIFCQTKTNRRDHDYHWTVAPDLIHACAIGASYGLTLHEHSCVYDVRGYKGWRNPTIFSRESKGNAPYLLVTLGGTEPPPEAPYDLKVSDSGDPDSLRLSLKSPKNGFTYDIKVNGKALPRWNTPFIKPGEVQVIPIRDVDLKPGEDVAIDVMTMNRVGERSKKVSIMAKVPAPAAVPAPEIVALTTSGKEIERISVIPLEDKYDETGKAVGNLPADYLVRNEVYDGTTIRLKAAKGEVVGFQVLLKGRGNPTVTCKVGSLRTDLFRALYVDSKNGRIPDPLVPFKTLALSNDVATPVCVDVYVPFDCPAGRIDGVLDVMDGPRVPIRLDVRSFALPREASFSCEMNGYGFPDKVSEFYRLQEVAYDHRVHVNLVHYSHESAGAGARKCNMDMVMSNGKRMNEQAYNDIKPDAKHGWWNDFASVFGPYLSGSCFKNGHRGPIAAPGFYLTFHESWPLNVRSYFNGNPDAYEAFKTAPMYSATFTNILKDFIDRAKREGWTKTGFQIYLNNKGALDEASKSPWILDEPTEYWDYRALRYFGELVRKAKGNGCPVKIDFRIDISRPEFDRGQLWGVSDLWVVNMDAFRKYARLVADRKERDRLRIWTYGSANAVEEPNTNTLAWVMEACRGGATGVVPWQTINKDGSALKTADPLGLFIFGENGPDGKVVHHSLRLKAFRRAEQDVEYLELVRKKLSWTDGQLRAFIDRYVPGGAKYSDATPECFRRLREAAAELIEKP